MKKTLDILILVHRTSRKKRLYLPHALQQMMRPVRMISSAEICAVIEHGEVIEDYPEDERGHSCLLLGKGSNGRPVHVVCSPKDEYLSVITTYIPDGREWSNNFRLRVKK